MSEPSVSDKVQKNGDFKDNMLIKWFDSVLKRPLDEFTPVLYPSLDLVNWICEEAIEVFKRKSCLVKISGKFIIVGDIHGSIMDLLRIFRVFGRPPQTRYLFLGDYVDRGSFSVPVICLLFSLMIMHPDDVFLLRGNHEFSIVNQSYGFLAECRERFGTVSPWVKINEAFDYCPLAALLNNEVFAVHGGISPGVVDVNSISDIQLPLSTFSQRPYVADLVWADPSNETKCFKDNVRGTGVCFGETAIERFMERSKIRLIVRGHQCIIDGFEFFADNRVVTLFSCANYRHSDKNKVGVMEIDKEGNANLYNLDLSVEGNISRRLKMKINRNSYGLVHTDVVHFRRDSSTNQVNKGNFKKQVNLPAPAAVI